MADQFPAHVSQPGGRDGGNLFARLLHTILAKHVQSMRGGGYHRCGGHRLRDRDDADTLRRAPGPLGGGGHSRPNRRDALGHVGVFLLVR